MSRLRIALLVSILALPVSGCTRLSAPAAQPPVAQASIARFLGDRPAAISLTFDDGFASATDDTVAMLEPLGFRGTFFPTVANVRDTRGQSLSWAEWKALEARGYEVGNHSLTHADLTKADATTLEKEVNGAFDLMAEHMGRAPFSFCYPYNARNAAAQAVVEQRHRAQTGPGRLTYGGEKWTLEQANARVDDAIEKSRWLVAMLHGVKSGYSAFENPDDFAAHLRYLQDHADRIWVAPYGQVARYAQERDSAELKCEVEKRRAVFTLTCGLDPAVYNQPLTVVLPAAGATRAEARRQGAATPLPASVRPDAVTVDVVPGPEPVTVRW